MFHNPSFDVCRAKFFSYLPHEKLNLPPHVEEFNQKPGFKPHVAFTREIKRAGDVRFRVRDGKVQAGSRGEALIRQLCPSYCGKQLSKASSGFHGLTCYHHALAFPISAAGSKFLH